MFIWLLTPSSLDWKFHSVSLSLHCASPAQYLQHYSCSVSVYWMNQQKKPPKLSQEGKGQKTTLNEQKRKEQIKTGGRKKININCGLIHLHHFRYYTDKIKHNITKAFSQWRWERIEYILLSLPQTVKQYLEHGRQSTLKLKMTEAELMSVLIPLLHLNKWSPPTPTKTSNQNPRSHLYDSYFSLILNMQCIQEVLKTDLPSIPSSSRWPLLLILIQTCLFFRPLQYSPN